MKHKQLFIKILISTSLLYNTNKSFAQIFDNEQAHYSEKWRSINSANFQLLFPKDFEPAAQRLAKELDHFIQNNNKNLQLRSKKITLILQGNHVLQNGYVQLAPRKSEIYPIPSSTPDNQEWLANTALHEMRHVAQFDKLTGRIRGPLFEQLALALYGLNLPAWYFEGDAVQTETLYSAGGRGRLPSWEMPIRANLAQGKNYTFSKYVLGSFRDNVPSYYTIGYLMSTYMTNHFGLESHEKIQENMHNKLLRPYNFQRALEGVSGLNSTQLYKETIQELAQKWSSERPKKDLSSTPIITKTSPYPSDFLLPQQDEEGHLYVLKSSPQIIPQIVQIDNQGIEKKVVKTGLQINPHYHLRGHQIIWDEYRKDARFSKRSYSVINTFDLKTGRTKTLSKNSKYYAPTWHPTKNEAALIEVLADNSCRILVIDGDSGQHLDSIPAPKNTHLQQPKYNAKGDKIILIGVTKSGTSLLEYDFTKGTFSTKLVAENQQLERPFYQGNAIVYKANHEGIDNIYRLDSGKKDSISRLTNAEFGAFNPYITPDGNLLFNDYKYNGYKLAQQNSEITQPKDSIQRSYYITKTAQNIVPLDTANALTPDFTVSKYNAAKHLINFHSLSISSNDFESFDNYTPGIFWLSNDLLNTTQVKLGYEYDTDIRKSIYSAELSYRKYYPIFTIKYQNRGQVGTASNSAQPEKNIMFDYREHYTTLEMSIPFSIYRQQRVYSYGFNFGTSYTKRYAVSIPLQNFNDEIAFPLTYQAYWNQNDRKSSMDLYPRWGQNLSITYRHLPFEHRLQGEILSARSNFYFPGLLTNHSIQLRAAAQKSSGRYQYSNDIPMVSGWGHFNSPKVDNTVMFNYRFPFSYPDWDVLSIVYVKRLQALLFSDFQNIHKDAAPKSMGIGLSADFHVFRYPLPYINVGTRFSYINDVTASQKIVPTFTLSYTY